MIISTTDCNPQHRVTSIATAFGPPNFQMEITPLISTANLSRLVAASFSSLALLSSSVSTVNLNCLLATTFSSLRLLSNSLSSPRFNLLRVARRCFLWFLFSRLILRLSFLCSSVAEGLFTLSFPFLSERFFFVHAKAALARSLNQ